MMNSFKVAILFLCLIPALFGREVLEIGNDVENETSELAAQPTGAQTINTWVIPIERQIDNATLAIVSRAMESAEAADIDLIVLKMDTPGGRLDMTSKIMELLDDFEGMTMTFVDSDALSAGAYISAATDEIYMAPKSIIGAAAVISGSGEDIPETLKQKIDSVSKARVRTLDKDYRYRADVIRAMMDSAFEFKIGDEVIKPAGELLSLTNEEAEVRYGTPPEALLSLGTYDSIEALLEARFGEGVAVDRGFELTWSEELAFMLNAITPAILSIGFLLIFIEFKTPGFGLFGTLGIGIFIFVFISQFVSGFSGHEPLIIFVIGVALLLVEIFLIPGTFVFGLLGLGLMTGSLIWALIGVLPAEGFAWDWGLVTDAVSDIIIGFVIAITLFIAIIRFLPKNMLLDKLVLNTAKSPQTAKEVGEIIGGVKDRPEIGAQGQAATDMMPSGTVSIAGKRFEAQASHGSIEKGEEIIVSAYASYSLIVKSLKKDTP